MTVSRIFERFRNRLSPRVDVPVGVERIDMDAPTTESARGTSTVVGNSAVDNVSCLFRSVLPSKYCKALRQVALWQSLGMIC